jgi:hypothetical protein
VRVAGTTRSTASSRTPPPSPPEDDPFGGEPEPFWRHAARVLGGLVVGRVRMIAAAIPLLFGGIFLAGAWDWGADAWSRRQDRLAMTGRGEARVEASWWRIDFDPEHLGEHDTNWRDLTRRTLCSRFRFVDGSDGGPVSVACRTVRRLDDGSLLLHADSPELPVRWRDEAGRPRLDLRLTARAEDWLAAHPALWWPLVPQDEATRWAHVAGSELDALLIEADHPAELLLLAHRQAAAPAVTMAFDPAAPARAMPLAALVPAADDLPDLGFLPFLALAGLLLWTLGCVLATLELRPWVRVAVVAGTLAFLPWWSGALPRALELLWRPAGQMFVFMGPELVGHPAAVASAEAEADGDWLVGQPVERARPLTFATSRYGDVLAPLADALPAPAPGASADELLAAAAAAATERVLALPDAHLAELVERLHAHGRLAAHGADLLFLEAMYRLSLDPDRPTLARPATLVLSSMASAEPPAPDALAAGERRRLWALLESHPEPIVFNLARR